MSADIYRRKAEELLRLASRTSNLKERGQLIDEAMRFHNLALEEHAHSTAHANDDESPADEARL